VVLCLHGEPSWCYLYRKMIPVFTAAGMRVLAPDLIGFGRSDKPADRYAYTYQSHVAWMTAWLEALDLRDVTLIAQDWGGLIGLRLLAEHPDRFARFSIANTGLPTGDGQPSDAFLAWRRFSQEDPTFDIGFICNEFGQGGLTDAEIDAYRAPFPSDEYKAGARQFPTLVPISSDDPARPANLAAWQVLGQWDKPVLLCFSDGDPITRGGEKAFLERVPGAQGQPHITLHGGHFIQNSDGPRWAQAVVDWIG
jgi:haloalkane dehalogenase